MRPSRSSRCARLRRLRAGCVRLARRYGVSPRAGRASALAGADTGRVDRGERHFEHDRERCGVRRARRSAELWSRPRAPASSSPSRRPRSSGRPRSLSRIRTRRRRAESRSEGPQPRNSAVSPVIARRLERACASSSSSSRRRRSLGGVQRPSRRARARDPRPVIPASAGSIRRSASAGSRVLFWPPRWSAVERLAVDFGLGVILWGVPIALIGVWPEPRLPSYSSRWSASATRGGRRRPRHCSSGLCRRGARARVRRSRELVLARSPWGRRWRRSSSPGFGTRGALVATGALPARTVLCWWRLAPSTEGAARRRRELELLPRPAALRAAARAGPGEPRREPRAGGGRGRARSSFARVKPETASTSLPRASSR